MGLCNNLDQMMPPAPKFTETDVPDATGKIYMVTGASAGVGKSLAQILYTKNATIYMPGRSKKRVEAAIAGIKEAAPDSKGAMHFIPMELEDLASVRDGAAEFLRRESHLDMLWHNAAVMLPPEGSVTKQGYELQFGTNTIAHFLLGELLTPALERAAAKAAPGEVRMLWVSSSAAELTGPKSGVDMDNLDHHKKLANSTYYGTSKSTMLLLALEYARRHKGNGVLSIPLNPGNLDTELRRHTSPVLSTVFGWMSHEPIKGAYTELYAAYSKEVSEGTWVIPWGRIGELRKDLRQSSLPESEGGTGVGAKLWDWVEGEVALFRL